MPLKSIRKSAQQREKAYKNMPLYVLMYESNSWPQAGNRGSDARAISSAVSIRI